MIAIQTTTLYLRVIMYPLAALGLSLIFVNGIQDGKPKSWKIAMLSSILVLMVVFGVEVLLLFQPDLHGIIKSILLTPAIVILTIGIWSYAFWCCSEKKRRLMSVKHRDGDIA